jgi:uncharacterized protein (DUF4415 family)
LGSVKKSGFCWFATAIEKMTWSFGSYRHGKPTEKRQESIYPEEAKMRKHYDFSNAIKNPHGKKLKTQITIRIESEVIEYFKNRAHQEDIP